jgi:hypothetical protein
MEYRGVLISYWWLTLDALAVYRLAVLVTKDEITARLRVWLGRPWAISSDTGKSRVRWWAFSLVICPWCISIWIGGGVVALTYLTPGVWQYPAAALAFSGVAGFLAER